MRTTTLAFAAAASTAATGCEGRLSVLRPAGPAARHLSVLGAPVLIGFLVVTAVVWLLLLWITLRQRGSFDEHAPIEAARAGQSWIIVGGFLIPAVVFGSIFVATLGTMRQFPMEHHHDADPDIRVVGHQWWWEVHYLAGGSAMQQVTTANEIHIPAGEPVEIELETRDVIHSFWVPRLHGKVDLMPHLQNRIRIQADEPGVYGGECAEFCGLQHANMRFLVVAQPRTEYERWLDEERLPAASPRSAQAQAGQKLFLSKACILCHTVRGTPARASVGPDLTHVASRRTIAADTLANDTANLHAWVTNAPSLKPGTRMPAFTQFSGDELHQLVAYLSELQ